LNSLRSWALDPNEARRCVSGRGVAAMLGDASAPTRLAELINSRCVPCVGAQVKSTTHAPRGAPLRLDSAMYQCGVDFKSPYSNRPLKPLTSLIG
jgi:hypothetical protein